MRARAVTESTIFGFGGPFSPLPISNPSLPLSVLLFTPSLSFLSPCNEIPGNTTGTFFKVQMRVGEILELFEQKNPHFDARLENT
jgi:hypothetical protein